MNNSEIRRFLSIGLLALISTIGMTWGTHVYADNECDKNDDNNCNHTEKNQKSSPKVECEVDTDITDHNRNTVVGPTDLQCNSSSSNIRDSTVIQNPPPNGGTDSLTVVSTDPSDGDNNVRTDLSEIKVTFNKKIDKNSVDTGSLALFANNCGTVFCNDPNIQHVSVSGKSVVFTIDNNDPFSPNTNYIASLLSSIQDEDGNLLDCANSKGVDDNCEWGFSTSGTSLSPTITLNPSTGPIGTTVTITGTGFAPSIHVVITFDGILVVTNPATVTTNSNGEFTASIAVPVSVSGAHTVAANLASKTFTVTSSTAPAITLNPTSGPVGSSVNITGTGFDPTSTVTITFGGSTVTTTPFPLTTNNNGEFSATFAVPDSSSGPQTVIATQGSNSASKTFTVTETSSSASTTPPSPNLSEHMIIPDVFA